MILALDPGTTETGWVKWDGADLVEFGVHKNERMLRALAYRPNWPNTTLAIEMIASYGMPVGAEVFDTCVWIGRFKQAWHRPDEVRQIFRKDVKLHLCNHPRAKDANVRQALIDLFPKTGAGKVPQIGTSKKPGPLFGVTSHVWPALGVAIYAAHVMAQPPTPRRRRATFP